jgi:hypothetical protein
MLHHQLVPQSALHNIHESAFVEPKFDSGGGGYVVVVLSINLFVNNCLFVCLFICLFEQRPRRGFCN